MSQINSELKSEATVFTEHSASDSSVLFRSRTIWCIWEHAEGRKWIIPVSTLIGLGKCWAEF